MPPLSLLSSTIHAAGRLLPLRLRRALAKVLQRTAECLSGAPASPTPQTLSVPFSADFARPIMKTYPSADTKESMLDSGRECRIVRYIPSSGTLRFEATYDPESRLTLGLFVRAMPAATHDGVTLKITVLQDGKSQPTTLTLPLSASDINVNYQAGQGWIDFDLPVRHLRHGRFEIEITAAPVEFSRPTQHLVEHGIHYHERHAENGRSTDQPLPEEWIAVQPPRILKSKGRKAKKIIFLSGESMIDPFFLRSAHGVDAEFPVMEDFARQSTVHSEAYATGDSTLSAIGAYFTGLFPLQHGVYSYAPEHRPETFRNGCLPGETPTLAETLRDIGFHTASLTVTPRMDWRYGYARGFDRYIIDRTGQEFSPSGIPLIQHASQILQDFREQDQFLFVHFDALHHPYRPIGEDRPYVIPDPSVLSIQKTFEVQSKLYAAMLRRLDRTLGEFFATLRHLDLFDRSMIVLTGDHGWYLHPWFSHRDYALFESRIRVPLWIKQPDWNPSSPGRNEIPCNQGLTALRSIRKATGLPDPAAFASLSQSDPAYAGVSITETVAHPTAEDLALVLRRDDYKYFASYRWNPDAKSLGTRTHEILLKRRDGTSAPPNADSSNPALKFPGVVEDLRFYEDRTAENRESLEQLRGLAKLHVERSLEYRSRTITNAGAAPSRAAVRA